MLQRVLEQLNNKRLRSYDADPGLLKEHFGIEETVLAGGYGYRQVFELVQNGADAMLEAQLRGEAKGGEGRIQVRLSGSMLYVANTGAPFDEEGLDALLRSHSSPKRGNQIGRFGLGFKSLLKLNGKIDVFPKSSGAIRFDPERCREELRQRYGVAHTPGLRLAWPLSQEERTSDPICSELAWAETIIRVEVGSESLLQHIRQEIRLFPSEFLLFFPVASTLTLDDGKEKAREIRLAVEDNEHVLSAGEVVSRWRIAETEVQITGKPAVEDATHIHARASVPISWAMPIEGRREEAGRFWAFFPTQTSTCLPGILNAPWKLNSDRNAIIGGEWNTALMTEAARLISETLPSLATQDDPARLLDAFPRQLDRKDDDAAPLVELIWTRLEDAAVIPDCTGTLRRAQELWRHPKDHLDLTTAWQSLASVEQQRQLVHASCLERQRASRLNSLADRIEAIDTDQNLPALRRCSIESWFGMVASAEIENAIGVLRLAESYSIGEKPGDWNQIRTMLAIIPTQSGNLATAARVVLSPEGMSVPDRESVAADLLYSSEARHLLKDVLCVSELDDPLWQSMLDEALGKISYKQSEADEAGWQAFWTLLRLAPESVRNNFVSGRKNRIRIRRRDGRWVQGKDLLLPGILVPESDTENNWLLIDLGVHGCDDALFNLLDISTEFHGEEELKDPNQSSIFKDWVASCQRQWFAEAYEGGSRPQDGYLQPLEGAVPAGLKHLARLRGAACAKFTLSLCISLKEAADQHIRFGHSTRTDSYPTIQVVHPLPWLLLEYGEIQISHRTCVPLRAIVARRKEPALKSLSNWCEFSFVLDALEKDLPKVTISGDDLHTLWTAAIVELATPENIGGDKLADLWIGAGNDGVVPTGLPSPTGLLPLSAIFVTSSPDLARRAGTLQRLTVVLDSGTKALWLDAGAQDLAGLIHAEWDTITGSPERLTDVIPELSDVLRESVRESVRCQRATKLGFRVDDTSQLTPCLMWDGDLLLDIEQLNQLSRTERLQHMLAEIAASGWLDGSLTDAIARLGDARLDERRAHVAQGDTLEERLLRAVGGRIEPLLDVLGQPLRETSFIQQCSPYQLAELVLAQRGPAALARLRDTLDAEGLQPPMRWNTASARAFASDIGFPPEFASSAEARREPEEYINGPIELPPLHAFQQEVFEGLISLLASENKRRRAVISLPTGGGKTRVMVEAAVRLVLAPEGATRSVLWIAQTDELCEQAVQAFRQVWVNLGAQRTSLRISRMWGGNPSPRLLLPSNPVVVVASIQTLNNRVGAADLDWLRKPGLVVVDECHHAITPSYSELLRWLDAELPRRGASENDEPPIVGLSATPFRTDDDESKRLARRFDNRWLPSNQEVLYERLLLEKVLAQPHYEPLNSGASLTDEEQDRLGRLREPWEGLDFENLLEAINQRLASDSRRNERLVECIETSDERSILFFTNSVAHAEEMSARLNLAGISTAAISGNTPIVARRYFLDRFQSGQVRVLCNHSVLTTGFDAPRTDMVLIARQVFSPVRYMQMVGRGLRGEKNGGTAKCRILTVIDNLGRFNDRHPYHYCRDLYKVSSKGSMSR